MKIDRALLRTSFRSWMSSEGPREGPQWLQWVWSFLLAVVLATGFTAFGLLAFGRSFDSVRLGLLFQQNLVVCGTITILIHLLFELSLPLVRPRLEGWRPWHRTLYFSGLPLLGVAVGWPLGITLAGGDLQAWLLRPQGWRTVASALLVALLVTFFLHNYFGSKARELQALQAATEAQLRLLQAQIEPHFLFNTLANVQSLMDHDTPRAHQMLAAFTDYLRASLGGLRREAAPLSDELALAEAYLRVQQTRMDDRLAYRIEVGDDARRALLPPLLLQPLVENAVHHGLEPKIDGGIVRVRAELAQGRLIVDVLDDGGGLEAHHRRRPGSGLALANIRERLATRYGPAASLELGATPEGTRARLILPVSLAPTPA